MEIYNFILKPSLTGLSFIQSYEPLATTLKQLMTKTSPVETCIALKHRKDQCIYIFTVKKDEQEKQRTILE